MQITGKILFVVNTGSGQGRAADYVRHIRDFFRDKPEIHPCFFELSPGGCATDFKTTLQRSAPAVVVAVGGDGTVKFVAGHLVDTDIPMGLLPAGSANGLALDLGIPENPDQALTHLLRASARKIHLLKINGELCIHLSDLGFNAHVIKKFDGASHRGMQGYLRAALKAFWAVKRMRAQVRTSEDAFACSAIMIVLANASRYGSGVTVNPTGDIQDKQFELVIVRRMSLLEILKMTFTSLPPDPRKTRVVPCNTVHIRIRGKTHFQIDGEYIGKVNEVRAELWPEALSVIF